MRSLVREILQTVLLALLIFMALQASIQNYRVEGSSMQTTLQGGQHLLVNKLVYYRLDKERLARWLPFLDVEVGEVLYPFHPPRRGEVVVFHFCDVHCDTENTNQERVGSQDPTRDFVKRIIAVPGDTVEVNKGLVYINDRLIDEPYITSSSCATSTRRECQYARMLLAENEYFVLGDNRPASSDSRIWGPVRLNDIVGRVWVTYWPFSDLGFLEIPPLFP